jgi:hypothetical protein
LYYYRARYYDAGIGKFISEDPIGFDGGNNLYEYVGGNPVAFADPSGEHPLLAGAIIGGGFDLALQLIGNGGRFGCVNWGSVAASGVIGGVAGAFLAPGGLLFGRGAGAAGRGTIVIGEEMSRVQRYASRIGADTFRGKTMAENQIWIEDAIKAGKKIIDIGPAFARRVRRIEQGKLPNSPFYEMERKVSRLYEYYNKVFERTGKYSGGVRGFD